MMNSKELIKKIDIGRVGNGTQTYNDMCLILNKEETLEHLQYVEQLEKENQELKETLNETRKMGLEIIEEKKQLSNELHKLNCYRNIELNEITKLKKALEILKRINFTLNETRHNNTSIEVWINSLFEFVELSQEEYELLKNTLEE